MTRRRPQALRAVVDPRHPLIHMHRDGGEVFSIDFAEAYQLVDDLANILLTADPNQHGRVYQTGRPVNP